MSLTQAPVRCAVGVVMVTVSRESLSWHGVGEKFCNCGSARREGGGCAAGIGADCSELTGPAVGDASGGRPGDVDRNVHLVAEGALARASVVPLAALYGPVVVPWNSTAWGGWRC